MSSNHSLRVNSLGIAQRPTIWERLRDRGPERSPVTGLDFERPTLRDTREARSWPLIAVALVVAGLILGIVMWRDAKAQTATLPLASATSIGASSPVSTATAATVPTVPVTTKPNGPNVYVSGAVLHPGVYVVREGSRINDAVLAAGGAIANANLDAINLASLVVDGDHVHVALLGDSSAPAVATAGTSTATGPQVVALNSATAAQLEVLPGVGPATAAAILEFRTKNGAFKSIDQLLDVPGIGPSKLDQMRSQLKL